MAQLASKPLESAVGIGAGAGGTLLVRDHFDQVGDNSIFRPSVLYGLGLGSLALGADMASGRGMMSVPKQYDDVLFTFGLSAFTTGAFSALTPKGATSSQKPSMG